MAGGKYIDALSKKISNLVTTPCDVPSVESLRILGRTSANLEPREFGREFLYLCWLGRYEDALDVAIESTDEQFITTAVIQGLRYATLCIDRPGAQNAERVAKIVARAGQPFKSPNRQLLLNPFGPPIEETSSPESLFAGDETNQDIRIFDVDEGAADGMLHELTWRLLSGNPGDVDGRTLAAVWAYGFKDYSLTAELSAANLEARPSSEIPLDFLFSSLLLSERLEEALVCIRSAYEAFPGRADYRKRHEWVVAKMGLASPWSKVNPFRFKKEEASTRMKMTTVFTRIKKTLDSESDMS